MLVVSFKTLPVGCSKEFLYIWRALKDHLRVIPPMFRYHLEQNADGIHYGHWNNLKFPDATWSGRKRKQQKHLLRPAVASHKRSKFVFHDFVCVFFRWFWC